MACWPLSENRYADLTIEVSWLPQRVVAVPAGANQPKSGAVHFSSICSLSNFRHGHERHAGPSYEICPRGGLLPLVALRQIDFR